ncbi:Sec-independent protein translocase subunit TatA [Solihabitans fulvus]|uniref:Sec-independent protein translocase protein TatA n=1 Tax=Solihabitans fulvus TaxID=1892852 RepID=A0A5B2WT08_9PSEU|nr:Sec-independent protein translocase subunit TatA [Solihabitans fulvus]KAA2254861.1 Sec-independent protein translocase subunit TatA [Solihabitans fulvus]
MGELSWVHWAIVALVFVVLFGAKKLPDAARGIGQSMRIFRAEMRADDTKPAVAPTEDTAASVAPQSSAPQASATTQPPTAAPGH